MRTLKAIYNIFYYLILLTLLLVAGLSALSVFGLPSSHRIFVVQSGSMEPAILTGSIVVVSASANYLPNDVISYKVTPDTNLKNPKAVITHRVAQVEENSGSIQYITKGDANETNDSIPVQKRQVLGKVVFTVPWIGYPVGFAKTPLGFALLIVIPATILVYSELLNIKDQAKKLIAEKKRRKLSLQENIEEQIGEKILEMEGQGPKQS